MKSKKVVVHSVYCPNYVKTIEEQFTRAKTTKDTMYSLKEFCALLDTHAKATKD